MNVKLSPTACTTLWAAMFQSYSTAWVYPVVNSRHYRGFSSFRNHQYHRAHHMNLRDSFRSKLLVGQESKSAIFSSSQRFLSTPNNIDDVPSFNQGDPIQVEILSFGPLGASVAVVGIGHGDNLLPVDKEPLGFGLILQKEIAYFREARDNVDVVRGEVLPAYVQKVREEDGKIDIGLRAFGGKAKAEQVTDLIMEKLKESPDGTLPVGDKSTPVEIGYEFPGVSKSVFKKAVGLLYKKGLVAPSPKSITLTEK